MSEDSGRRNEAPHPEGYGSQIGYRPTWTGENVTRENAQIEPVNAERQAEFEQALWRLRQP